ncbi:MAG: 16S rRNA (cytosine(1402)-N(4))-methyltransferase RsmH, partial [Verrucomicrobia bacterium]|nr:16S rRNA (cytosine(1402)-N(4))-methyltransferase RsmH [Verrucomicrobiota bacterium]
MSQSSESSRDPSGSNPVPHKRRRRYPGTHPRRFEDKYKEHDPAQHPETVTRVMASGKTPAGMHRPVMMDEVMAVLSPAPGEVGVDCTLGYGGHAGELWRRIQPGGRLIALDADPVELEKTGNRLRELFGPSPGLTLKNTNFAGISKALVSTEIEKANFILADLGVSSMQIDDPARGFSFKHDGPLDLRMNPRKGMPASFLLTKLTAEKLAKLLRDNADEPQAEALATKLIFEAGRGELQTTRKLAAAIETALREAGYRLSPEELRSCQQRVFQALRIAVNDEFAALDMLLRQLPACLEPRGRVAILSFHSGEDRRIKHAFEKGWKEGWYSSIAEEVLRPTPEERHANPRAACAKLRWAIRSERTTACVPEDLTGAIQSEHPLVLFRDSLIHGRGGFARGAIPASTRVIEYIGERITKA